MVAEDPPLLLEDPDPVITFVPEAEPDPLPKFNPGNMEVSCA